MGIRFVYLAYPIDQAGGTPGMHDVYLQVDFAKRWLADHGVGSYDPGDAFSVGTGQAPGPEVAHINRVAQAACDATVAWLVPGVPSVGVPVEIDRADARGQALLVVGGAGWQHAGWRRAINADRVNGKALEALLQTEVADRRDGGAAPLEFGATTGARPEGGDAGWSTPTRGHHDDAGLDLYVSEDVTVAPGTFETVPTGLAVSLPEWGWGLLTGRSSALLRGLLVKDAVIDTGYRGELFANAWNLTAEPITVKAGDRIAQLVVMANSTRGFEPVVVALDDLPRGSRGTRGFGSTGN